MLTADCHPITVVPGLHRLFLDYCSSDPAARAFHAYLPSDESWRNRPPLPAHWPELVRLLAEQNASPSPAAAEALQALSQGAGAVVTGQQVGLFGGPLFTPYKAATALAHARSATNAGPPHAVSSLPHAVSSLPHAAIFWLATEDHDFAEIDHVVFPTRRELRKLVYAAAPAEPRPVGGIVLDDSITALLNEARELLEPGEALDALAAAYQPDRTLAQAFAEFYSRVFAAQGLLTLDASSRAFHRLGSSILRAAIERADELHAALLDRNHELEAAGYHAQVAVAPNSSLLFLIDQGTDTQPSGARLALKRLPPTAQEPQGLWQTDHKAGSQAGRQNYSTADLVAILDAEPERISPAALLRPVFQDFLLAPSAIVGGPAEIAYFAQSAVLYQRILGTEKSEKPGRVKPAGTENPQQPGRVTPALPRFSATLIEPAIADLLRKYSLTLDRVFAETPASLAQLLAARSMPAETKEKLASTAAALEAELLQLVDWMRTADAGLGQAAETAAGKIRYQMDRLRTLAANFQLQREAQLTRQAEAITQALYPSGALQERLHGAAYYFARHGFALAEELTAQAANRCPGHTALWLD